MMRRSDFGEGKMGIQGRGEGSTLIRRKEMKFDRRE